MGLFNIFSRKQKAFEPYVEWDKSSVTCYRSTTLNENLEWDKLEAVIIETTDQGPFCEDVFWILVGNNEKGVVVPQGIKGFIGDNGLLHRLQQLPGFDNQAVMNASVCTENKRFLCWKKSQ